LDNKVFDIIDARYNHGGHSLFTKRIYLESLLLTGVAEWRYSTYSNQNV